MKTALKKLMKQVEDQLDSGEERLLSLTSDEAFYQLNNKLDRLEEVFSLLEEALQILERET